MKGLTQSFRGRRVWWARAETAFRAVCHRAGRSKGEMLFQSSRREILTYIHTLDGPHALSISCMSSIPQSRAGEDGSARSRTMSAFPAKEWRFAEPHPTQPAWFSHRTFTHLIDIPMRRGRSPFSSPSTRYGFTSSVPPSPMVVINLPPHPPRPLSDESIPTRTAQPGSNWTIRYPSPDRPPWSGCGTR